MSTVIDYISSAATSLIEPLYSFVGINDPYVQLPRFVVDLILDNNTFAYFQSARDNIPFIDLAFAFAGIIITVELALFIYRLWISLRQATL